MLGKGHKAPHLSIDIYGPRQHQTLGRASKMPPQLTRIWVSRSSGVPTIHFRRSASKHEALPWGEVRFSLINVSDFSAARPWIRAQIPFNRRRSTSHLFGHPPTVALGRQRGAHPRTGDRFVLPSRSSRLGLVDQATFGDRTMTTNRDFKRLVRARMAKTGESYTAARRHLATPDNTPSADEYADLAGVSDDTVRAKTGLAWTEWVAALDTHGAVALDHTAIAAAVTAGWPEIGGWWSQTVTVGYERIRGLRQKGQLCTGSFAASKSRTFIVPVAELFAAFEEGTRERWMGASPVGRTARANRSVRLTWPDGTVVSAWFTDKGAKSSVAIQHDKLASAAHREAEKAAWADRLTALASQLAAN